MNAGRRVTWTRRPDLLVRLLPTILAGRNPMYGLALPETTQQGLATPVPLAPFLQA